MIEGPTHPGRVEALAGVRGLATALVTGLAVVLAGPAAAAVRPAIQVFPAYGPPGTVVRVTGQGFCGQPCSPVSIVVATQEVAVGVVVSAAGRFDTRVRVPGGLPAGTAPVVARQTDGTGATVSASGSFDVTPGVPAPTRLPAPTGSAPVQPVPGATSTTSGATHSSSRPAGTATTAGPTTGTTTSPVTTGATAPSSGPTAAASADPSRHGTASWWWGVLGLGLLAAAAVAVVLRARRRRTSGT